MLTTCRLIYSEAIEFLYKSNSFFISTKSEDYPTAGYLSYFFLPQRMNQITKLHLDWDLDHGQHFHPNLMPGGLKDEWFNAWDALKKLTGLNQLYIRLFFRYDLWNQCYGFFWERNSEQLLEPVKAITTPRDFTIKLPNWRCPTDIDVGDSHCVFEVPARVDGDDVDDSLW
ncbi:hypothetical protein BDW02DRAFT_588043 [Decorospora gaudefroyi]|uniref:DUF7730 domain-containing protein n=1 Tax=Decorospora gaudefroyi TaxID=184978 RepID=A0A6A5KHG6_9PLEO|nr:hypothetical protein BDW02DRAFT_588043 [Decorospora gaudefroyi]